MREEDSKKIKLLYLHGRPGAHPVHRHLAESVATDFRFIDEPVRWQDKGRGILYNLSAWIINAFLFKQKKRYDAFLVDNLHLTIPIMRMFGLLNRKQKTIVHLGSHTLYFMYSGQFSRLNNYIHKLALRKYDALVCEGKMAQEIAKLLLKEKCPPTYTTYLGPRSSRSQLFKQCNPDLESNSLLIVAAGPEKFREFYKGLDIMVKSFGIAHASNPRLKLTILGSWKKEIIQELLSSVEDSAANAIKFAGSTATNEEYFSYLNSASLCYHCTRGDAFPTSTVEAMGAGLPTLVSEWTGTKEIVNNVDARLVVKLDVNEIAKGIEWYFSLTKEEKQKLSNASREAVVDYNEEAAVSHYKKTFEAIYKDLNLVK